MEHDVSFWGRKGLLSALLLDLADSPASVLNRFLKAVEFPEEKSGLHSFRPASVEMVLDADLGTRGFGRPGALVLFRNQQGKKKTVLFEARRTTFANASKPSSMRGTKGFHSSVNGSLELNYCLVQALAGFRKRDTTLADPEWVVQTPYNMDRNYILRVLKDRDVLKNVILPVAGLKPSDYHHILITTDEINPYFGSDNLPELYDKEGRNTWDGEKGQFGWVNYQTLEEMASSWKRERFYKTLAMYKPHLDFPRSTPSLVVSGPGRGVSVVCIPSYDPGKMYVLSWQRGNAVVREYPDPDEKPVIVKKGKISEFRSIITLEVISDKPKPVSDSRYWYNSIIGLEQLGLRTLFGTLARLAGLTFNSEVTFRRDPGLVRQHVETLVRSGVNITPEMVSSAVSRKLKKDEVPDLEYAEVSYPEGISLLDLFASYDPDKREIVLYDGMIRLGELALGADPEVLTRVVLAHCAGHAVTHRGRDGKGNSWRYFRESSSKNRETFAQVYPMLHFRNMEDNEALNLHRELAKYQSPSYNLWSDYLYMDLTQVNLDLKKVRSEAPAEVEILVFRYDGRNPWCPVDILTNDGRIFNTRFEGLDWKSLGITDFHMEPYMVPSENLNRLRDLILSSDIIYLEGGLLRSRAVTEGERGSTTIRITINSMENEWTGVGRDWGEYGYLFRRILNLFDEAIEEASR